LRKAIPQTVDAADPSGRLLSEMVHALATGFRRPAMGAK